MREDITARVKKVLAANLPDEVNPGKIGDDQPLIELGVGIDSVARLELLVALEEEFLIKLDESEITPEFFETVESISEHIYDCMN